jgi:excisionase family DNA binding protein
VNARERPIERLAYGPSEAAAALGVSREFFDTHVLPELKAVRLGRRILVSVTELERWLARNEKELLP